MWNYWEIITYGGCSATISWDSCKSWERDFEFQWTDLEAARNSAVTSGLRRYEKEIK